ncbi:topoisomerase DNA-binding C4 zinc finger domain-containing protein, partial [Xenorhabdus mauleonii]
TLDSFMQKQAQWLAHLMEKGKAQPIQFTLPKPPVCPRCGGTMQKRMGKTTPFWGCTRYPACKGMLNASAVTGSRKNRRGNSSA